MQDDPTPAVDDPVARAIAENGGSGPGPGQTFIYFIQSEHGGPIKIGRSKIPLVRLMDLQIANPYTLRITNAAIGAPNEEQRLHALFADFRLRGEWFKAHPALANIARATPDESLADVPFEYTTVPSLYDRQRRQEQRLNEYHYEMALDDRLTRERYGGNEATPPPCSNPITYRPAYPLDEWGHEVEEPSDREFLGF